MKLIPLIALAASAFFGTPALAEDQVTGTWRSDDEAITFRAAYCGEGVRLCATLVEMKDRSVPILAPLVGEEIEVNSTRVRESAWRVTPIVGLGLVSAIVEVLEPGRIDVTGCLAGDCRSLRFSRIGD